MNMRNWRNHRSLAADLLALSVVLVTTIGISQPAFSQLVADAQTADSVKSLDDLVLHDDSRNPKKDLHVRVTYTQSAKPLPVIVFSHGAGGSKDSYPYLAKYWAQNGFIVIQPTHQDSIGKPKNATDGFRKLIAEVRKLPTDYAGWNNRVRDISFVIDSLPIIQKESNTQLDAKRLGVGGHSYGAFTAVIIGGGKVPEPAKKFITKSRDERVKAILAISPQCARSRKSDFGFDDKTAWQNITGPAMFMTGTYDQTGRTKAADRRQAFEGSPAGGKFYVVIKGANHMTFAGRSGASNASASGTATSPKASSGLGIAAMFSRRLGPPEKGDREQMLKAIQFTTTKFWNAFVKDDESQPQSIDPNDLQKANELIQIEPK